MALSSYDDTGDYDVKYSFIENAPHNLVHIFPGMGHRLPGHQQPCLLVLPHRQLVDSICAGSMCSSSSHDNASLLQMVEAAGGAAASARA